MSRKSERRKKDVKREPNGRASRRKTDVMAEFLKSIEADQRDAQGTALQARHRVHGVLPSQTKDQMAGSFIGRLCLQGVVTRAQYHAAQSWLDDSRRYSIAMASPRGMGAVDLNATHGRNDHPEDEERTLKAIADFTAAKDVIQAAQNELRLAGTLYAALYYIVNRDLELHHLIGSARLALNALVKHYGWNRLEAA